MTTTDPLERVVHAVSATGTELVRYDTAGKWYIEWPSGSMIPCEHVTIAEAARTALRWEAKGGTVLPKSYGGTRLHSEIRKLRDSGFTP